jgi:hypothetical protein
MAWFRSSGSQRAVRPDGSPPRTRPTGALALVAVSVATSLAASGCVIVRDDAGDPVYDDWPYDEVVYETIDADQVLHTALGEGVGLFVEYYAGGTWRLWTSCDTALTNAACTLEAHVVGESALSRVYTDDFEGYDSVDLPYSDELWLYAETTYDSDGVEFDTDPGAAIELELWVDGYLDPGFIYWVGDGFIHEGAPSTPLVLTPDRP